MKIKIGNFDCTECWDGVFYKKLSAFPKITDWEIQTVLDFIAYEKLYGRECQIEASDEIISQIEQFKSQNKMRLSAPAKITECTACPTYKGCMTDFVCHTSPVENAVKILHPYAVDVSSGIETKGLKSKTKMSAFVAAVRKEDRL